MTPDPLLELLDPAAASPSGCAQRCAEALRRAGVEGCSVLALVGPSLREDLAPAWTAVALAEGAARLGRDRGRAVLARLAAEVESLAAASTGGGPSWLAVALRLAHGRGYLDPDDLRAAISTRRTELEVASFATRRELAEHLRRRGRALPRLFLRRLAGASERRLLLVDSAVLASELARGLAVQGPALELGRLLLTSEDFARLGVSATALRQRPTPEPLRRAYSEQTVWAREQLAKSWALVQDLGWRRAPFASAWLRGIEERLRALEQADFDLAAGPAQPTRAGLALAWTLGALWWLPPRSVAAHQPMRNSPRNDSR
ncbi:hypothetical protein [Engelhardtia mirabilis]|uniref:Squalene/phytoene synthase n=1 Tax=Engelhardtia mirabilis TaxID=2528011 RepID=A0A518BDJ0_9BACT|nr:Squalene/phytoene synthase [Planctomycetes bacterium Pla133]QDU99360.1 Squalene/phytoene synthase [Planctomycetes bacterium Pla86]